MTSRGGVITGQRPEEVSRTMQQRMDNEAPRTRRWLKEVDGRLRPALSRWIRDGAELGATPETQANAEPVPRDPFAEELGIELEQRTAGDPPVARLTVATRHLDRSGQVRSSVLFVMAEAVLTRAMSRYGVSATLVDATATLIAPARRGDELTAECDEVAVRRRFGVYTVKIANRHGEIIALFQGTAARNG